MLPIAVTAIPAPDLHQHDTEIHGRGPMLTHSIVHFQVKPACLCDVGAGQSDWLSYVIYATLYIICVFLYCLHCIIGDINSVK